MHHWLLLDDASVLRPDVKGLHRRAAGGRLRRELAVRRPPSEDLSRAAAEDEAPSDRALAPPRGPLLRRALAVGGVRQGGVELLGGRPAEVPVGHVGRGQLRTERLVEVVHPDVVRQRSVAKAGDPAPNPPLRGRVEDLGLVAHAELRLVRVLDHHDVSLHLLQDVVDVDIAVVHETGAEHARPAPAMSCRRVLAAVAAPGQVRSVVAPEQVHPGPGGLSGLAAPTPRTSSRDAA
mmetsp:Transcript_27846/g.61510  ORF Transcript_27846/g.61510 Transcript_27846/m.61510 type:complete len:235 (+) Transcript_27846:316-1020(+)